MAQERKRIQTSDEAELSGLWGVAWPEGQQRRRGNKTAHLKLNYLEFWGLSGYGGSLGPAPERVFDSFMSTPTHTQRPHAVKVKAAHGTPQNNDRTLQRTPAVKMTACL